MASWIKNQHPLVCCLQEIHLTCKDTHRLKIKGWKNIDQANGKQEKARVAILVSNKTDFKPTKMKKNYKERRYIIVKGTIQQEVVTILNIYVPNTGAPRFIK